MKIGFLGTGLMGQPMALRLLQANYEVTAYNRTHSKLQPLAEAGAKIAASATEVIEQADCVILMLTDAAVIRDLILSETAKSNLVNRTIIQMATIAPKESQSIRDGVVTAGGEYFEAPVLGSIPQVKAGELIVMVGSTKAQFDKYSELLKHYSPEPMYIGEVGKAAAIKLALNQLIPSLISTFSLSLSLVQHLGVDVEQFMEVLRQSAIYAPTFDKKLPRMRDRDFTNPNFPTKHLLKDTNLIIQQATELGLNTSHLHGVKQIIETALSMGLDDLDYSAIYNAINPPQPNSN
ncbi:MAG: NAD(P)-dependent oxidoreductase [Cyanobacteria bacterium P01_A01_bin.40]